MRCPKCNGRTVVDDVHTYLGREEERRCIVCGNRITLANSEQSGKSDTSGHEKKEEEPMAAKGTCTDCKRPDMAIVAHGRCGKCYYHAVKDGIITVNSKKSKTPPTPPSFQLDPDHPLARPASPPLAAPVPPAALAAPPEATILPAATVQERDLVQVTFDERDKQLLQRLEESARFNRRTLAAEILYRLDRTFDAA